VGGLRAAVHERQAGRGLHRQTPGQLSGAQIASIEADGLTEFKEYLGIACKIN